MNQVLLSLKNKAKLFKKKNTFYEFVRRFTSNTGGDFLYLSDSERVSVLFLKTSL